MYRSTACFASLLFLLSTTVVRGLEIDFGYDPSRHNMFLSGFPGSGGTPVRNPNILGMPSLDFSGVGWGTGAGQVGKNIAMITPQHFVLAEHYGIPIGSQVNFLNRDGQLKSYTIDSYINTNYQGIKSDLMIGVLTAPIAESDNIASYSIVNSGIWGTPFDSTSPEVMNYYLGKQIVNVGKNDLGAFGGKVSLDTIGALSVFNFPSGVTTVGAIWQSQPGTLDSGRLVGGDSGSPMFMLYNGQLTLLGAHAGIDAMANPQINAGTFIPWYIDQINAAIFPSGFQLSIIPVPEPSSALLVAGGFVLLLGVRRFRRKVTAA